jgi:probable phosphoglycerate mutase
MPESAQSTLVLACRHARVADEWDGKIYGDMEVPLSPDGLAASRRLPARLPSGLNLSAVISSPLDRATAAAEAVGEATGLQVTLEPDIREVHRATWRGKGWDEVGHEARRAYQAAPASFRGHGGETMDELRTRATSAVRHHAAAHQGGTVLVVAHRWACSSLALEALRAPTDRILNVTLDPLGLSAFHVDPRGGFHLLCWNLPGHLPRFDEFGHNRT